MTLKQKTVTGVMWTGLAKLSMQVLLLIVSIILANLLTPSDFGIVGMTAVVTVAIGMFNDRGLGTVVVQRKTITDSSLSTLFWGGLGLGIILFIIFAVASIPVSLYFKKQIVMYVMTVQALGFVIGGFGIVQKSLLTRIMDFKKLAIIEICAVLASAVASISLAYLGFGLWSLVALLIVRDLVTVILLWSLHPWHPVWHFSWTEFKSFYHFSANVLGNDVALYVISNTDVAVIGRVLGSAMLGFYSWALNLIKLPVTRISGIVVKVTFPAFSAVQDNPYLFKKGFLKAIMFLSVISFPILGCIGLFAHEFIMIFLGEKWMQMKIPLILLVPMGMLKSVGTLKGAVLMACGRPDIELKWNIAYFLPLLLAVYFGTRYGLAGVAAAFTGLYLLTFPVIQTITNRLVKVSAREFCKTLTPASLGITVMIGIVLLFKYIAFSFLHLELLTVFILGLILACTGYLTVIWLMNREFLKEIVHLVLFNKSKMSAKQELLDIKVGS